MRTSECCSLARRVLLDGAIGGFTPRPQRFAINLKDVRWPHGAATSHSRSDGGSEPGTHFERSVPPRPSARRRMGTAPSRPFRTRMLHMADFVGHPVTHRFPDTALVS